MKPPFSRLSTALAGCQIPCRSGWSLQVRAAVNACPFAWPKAAGEVKEITAATMEDANQRFVIFRLNSIRLYKALAVPLPGGRGSVVRGLLLAAATSGLRLRARIQGDVPAVGEIHARCPHEIGSVLRQKAVNRELLTALNHVLPPAGAVQQVGRRGLGAPHFGLAVRGGHFEG